MTAGEFAAWVDAMRAARGWTGRECARQLGCDKNQIGTWSERGAPAYIGLACAALARNMQQWSPKQ